MKKILFLFILTMFTCARSFSQEVIVTNQKSSEMYSKAKSWVAVNFKSANDVIQADIPNEKIIVKGISKNTLISKYGDKDIPFPWELGIVVTFDIKEGKYRYSVETSESPIDILSDERAEYMVDSVLKVTPGGGMIGKKGRESMKVNMINIQDQKNKVIKGNIESTASSIKSFMLKNDNW